MMMNVVYLLSNLLGATNKSPSISLMILLTRVSILKSRIPMIMMMMVMIIIIVIMIMMMMIMIMMMMMIIMIPIFKTSRLAIFREKSMIGLLIRLIDNTSKGMIPRDVGLINCIDTHDVNITSDRLIVNGKFLTPTANDATRSLDQRTSKSNLTWFDELLTNFTDTILGPLVPNSIVVSSNCSSSSSNSNNKSSSSGSSSSST